MSSVDMYRVDIDYVLKLHHMYKDGMSLTDIGKKMGHSRHSIKKWFIGFNLDYTEPKRKSNLKYGDETVLKMYDLYKDGMSTVKIAKEFNISPSTVSKCFNRLNLEMRSNSINSRKYSVNHNYFQEIDTEDKAYWLGFIYADGYITSRDGGQMFGMSLSSNDKKALEDLNKCLDSNYKINDYAVSNGYKIGSKYSRLVISSEKICDDLRRHGVINNKTNILKRPSIENHLIRHFIRGYIDGDGSIFKTRNKYGFNYHINILGTDDVLRYIVDYLFDNNLVKRKTKCEKRKDNQIVSYIRYGGNAQVEKILNHIYEDAKFYLDRKYNVYRELLDYRCRL